MDEFLKLPREEQNLWITQTAAIKGLSSIVIEKDYWVCWVLKELFSIEEIKKHVVFKGGTSLSKVYKVIERFSEDVDLTISKEYLGLDVDLSDKSSKQQNKYLKKLKKELSDKLRNELLPLVERRFSEALERVGISDKLWSLEVAEEGSDAEESILFYYPRILHGTSKAANYVKPVVKLEFGVKGEKDPKEQAYIDTYIAEATNHFHMPRIAISTLKAERTFWEKATILHMYYHWPEDKPIKSSMSRHYYDLLKLSHASIGESAIGDGRLLARVAEHKAQYFPSNWASYDTARIGQIKLVPSKHLMPVLRRDYKDMQEMFFGEVSSFEQLMKEIEMLEQKINDYKRILEKLKNNGDIKHEEHLDLIYEIEGIILKLPKLVQDNTKSISQVSLVRHSSEEKEVTLREFNTKIQEAYFKVLDAVYNELNRYAIPDKTTLFLAVENQLYSKLMEGYGSILREPLISGIFGNRRGKKIEKILGLISAKKL